MLDSLMAVLQVVIGLGFGVVAVRDFLTASKAHNIRAGIIVGRTVYRSAEPELYWLWVAARGGLLLVAIFLVLGGVAELAA